MSVCRDGLVVLSAEQVETMIERAAERALRRVIEPDDDRWMTTQEAADYLGVHVDTLRKAAAERSISFEQDGPGCKLFFRRSALDAWRRGQRP